MATIAPPGIAAAIVLYRPEPSVLGTLLDALEQDGLPIIVFVNGPLDPVVETRLAGLAHGTVIRVPENIGLGAGLNAVAGAAIEQGCSHILLFDQDSTPGPGLAAALSGVFTAPAQRHRRVAAVGPLLTPPPGESFLPITYDRLGRPAAGGLSEVAFLPTSGTLVCLSAFCEIGPFRADYFVDGIDVEWCYRARARVHVCLLAEDVAMTHRWGHAEGEGVRVPQILRQSPLRSYYYLRNRSHNLKLRHFPLGWKVATAFRLLAQAALLVLRGGAPLGMLRLTGRAFRDGLTGRLGPAPSAE